MAANLSWSALGKATDLRNRIVFTIGLLIVYRVGTYIPVPGIDSVALQKFMESANAGIGGLLNLFTGGAISRMGVFALGIMPYISASIIVQLLASMIPQLEQLKKEGDAGRKKINQYTRYGTVLLATFQAYGLAASLEAGDLAHDPGMFFRIACVITLVGGTLFLMWVGEQITARGIGNGISLIIFAGIVAELPRAIYNLVAQARTTSVDIGFVLAIAAMVIGLIVFIVFIERSQRRLIIHYPKRQQSQGFAQGQRSFLPLKINTAGVIPPIFASALLMLPMTAVGFLGSGAGADPAAATGILGWLAANFSPGSWTYIVTYALLVVFFAFFYTSIMFNPQETADNLRKYGGFIPGIRPGSNTAAYIDYVLTRLTTIGTLYLVFICILPELLRVYFPQIPFYIGGTSLLIVVSVTMDTVTQIQSHLIAHQYEGMIKKSKLGGKRK